MTKTLVRLARLGFHSSLLALCACGSEEEGTISIRAYGESFVEEGVPASEVADGWALDFSRFEVRFRDVTVGGAGLDGEVTADLADASGGQGHALGSVRVPPGKYTDASFTVSRLEVIGNASKDGTTKTFSWLFDQPTRYDECDATMELAEGGAVNFEMTIHADHLLADSLVSEHTELRFQALADADTDGDGEITQAELASKDIGLYDPGSEGGITDLWSWLTELSQRVGHVNGEGHCHTSPVK